ncbi:SGNH/GDSL hydrolase family protein [Bacillus sp. FJAT-42376]|uniref:SGNH/GDSL hydrolase family protein n=1 Tax=Bacillus sp. FJAT-42376 TaxID=2014076 RepID=UPI0013DE48CD|nr:SGNH/GDSL hydrolase family protein [Bacillus sp. FJAT-42376]
MRMVLIWLSSLMVLLAGCDQFSLSPREPVHKKPAVKKEAAPVMAIKQGDVTITGIGDSLTAGIGDDSKNGGYVGVVKTKLSDLNTIDTVAVNNYAVLGNQTTDLMKKLQKKEVKNALKESDIILLTIGGNDIMKVVKDHIFDLTLQPFEKAQTGYEERLNSIFQTIRHYNPDAKIIYSGLYNPFKFALPELSEIDVVVEDWNGAAKKLIEADGNAEFVPVADLYDNPNEGLLYKDSFHPNTQGYSLIGERVYEAILRRDGSR